MNRVAASFSRFALALLLALATPRSRAQEQVPEPTLRAVSDFAGLLSPDEQSRIEAKLRDYRDRSGNQIVFVSVPVAWRGDDAIESYSIKLAEKWRIGRKKEDNGVIFLIVGTPRDREGRGVRFEVGYGLEGTLPDAVCKRIQLETVVPRLKAGDYFGAADQGTDALITVLGGGTLPQRSTAHDPESWPPWVQLLVIVAVVLIIIIFRSAIFSSMYWGGGSGWSSAGWGGGGGWSGGGGSFGGGGGSFGGGGASSSW